MVTSTDTELLIKLTSAQAKLQRALTGPLSVHGISMTEYLVLRELDRAPGKKLRRIDLAKAVGLTPSGVTRLLNPMEKIGLVGKEAGARDARVSLVAITAVGETIYRESTATFAETSRELLAPLSKTDRDAMTRVLNAVLKG